MSVGNIISSVISGVAVLLLAAIAKAVMSIRGDFKRFMLEHTWLLATTLWTRDKVLNIMEQMKMPVDNPPPADLPNRSEP